MSHYTNDVRVVPAAATLAAINTGGTQAVTEIDGDAFDMHLSNGLRFRKVHAVVQFDHSSTKTHRWGFVGNFQSRRTTSGTGSTWADFGDNFSQFSTTVAGTSGTKLYAYQSAWQRVPAQARYVRLQYTPKGFLSSNGALTTASGGIADITPSMVFSDPNRYPADTPV